MYDMIHEDELEDFIQWYWKEIDGKPYQMTTTEVIKWYLEDDSIGMEKTTTKYYSLVEAIDEGIERRNNMIAATKLIILAMLFWFPVR